MYTEQLTQHSTYAQGSLSRAAEPIRLAHQLHQYACCCAYPAAAQPTHTADHAPMLQSADAAAKKQGCLIHPNENVSRQRSNRRDMFFVVWSQSQRGATWKPPEAECNINPASKMPLNTQREVHICCTIARCSCRTGLHLHVHNSTARLSTSHLNLPCCPRI